jgi:hypothetical protein
MFALVKDGSVIRTTNENSFEWNGFSYSNASLLSREDRMAAGIYDFVTAQGTPPEGMKAQGTSVVVGDGVVTESYVYVDTTPEELNVEHNLDIQSRIDAIEASCTPPRRVREAILSVEGKTWMEDKEARIIVLRGKFR